MTSRSTSLGCAGMTISFIKNFLIILEKYIKTHSFFNQFLFYECDDLIPGHLDNYELFKSNINFHAEKVYYVEK